MANVASLVVLAQVFLAQVLLVTNPAILVFFEFRRYRLPPNNQSMIASPINDGVVAATAPVAALKHVQPAATDDACGLTSLRLS